MEIFNRRRLITWTVVIVKVEVHIVMDADLDYFRVPVITYLDEPEEYIEEIGIEVLVKIINEMDSDDAVDLLENINDEVMEKLRPILNSVVKADIKLICSYDDDQIGSLITTNYICITRNLSVKKAMHELVRQAGDNDNISTIYVVDADGSYCGSYCRRRPQGNSY